MGTMRTVKYGSRNKEVGTLQKLLGLTVDNQFGLLTKNAVIDFQKANGLAADGICGPATWTKLKKLYTDGKLPPKTDSGNAGGGDNTAVENAMFKPTVDYKQTDPKWKDVIYSICPNGIYVDPKTGEKTKQTIGTSGCGPTSCANVIATIAEPAITPMGMASAFVKGGYRTANKGTSYGAFKWAADKFNLMFKQTTSMNDAKKFLANGGYVVCSMGPGYWAKGGHYITAWKYDDKYIYCNDPASKTRVKQTISQFTKECKQMFCYKKR